MSAGRRSVENEPAETDRADRLVRIRREIADGTYETEEKLEASVDALVEQISRREISSAGDPPNRPK